MIQKFHLILRTAFYIALAITVGQRTAHAQTSVWDTKTYPDEGGYQRRIAGMLERLSKRDVGVKMMANSVCPDTGLPVRTFAVKGEEIISPYTGRKYIQGDVGFFGPQARGKDGRITAFGNDPLKQDLPPATARLLLNPGDTALKAFLDIPGNLRQQYHFACCNWARFYPLLADTMGEAWQRDFKAAVAVYTENNHPSDGNRKFDPLQVPHDLVGEPGQPLGGNPKDGGTENHKTMWRTSGLLYAQILGKDAIISGHPAAEAEKLITPMLTGFLKTILTVGNGEYDSSTYYPYGLRPYLNLYDFSPKAETRALAKGMLDYYVAGFGLKVFNGTHVGAEKRGWTGDGTSRSPMDEHLYLWANRSTIPEPTDLVTSIHQITSTYRPNRILYNIVTKNIKLPFEAQMARPSYFSSEKNLFQESFYCASGYALGSVAMTRVDNPTQQTIWSLVSRGDNRSFVFGGGQPHFRHPEGHSAYDQTIQKRGAMILLTGQTQPKTGKLTTEEQQRAENARERLVPLPIPDSKDTAAVSAFWEKAPTMAASWLFVPHGVGQILEREGAVFIAAGEAFVAVRPVAGKYQWLRFDPQTKFDGDDIRSKYDILSIPMPTDSDGVGGFVIEAANRSDYSDLESFAGMVLLKSKLDVSHLKTEKRVVYNSLAGDRLNMTYQPSELRALGEINGEPMDWAGWANGGVYDSPYLTIKNGTMRVTDGREAYTVSLDKDAIPTFR